MRLPLVTHLPNPIDGPAIGLAANVNRDENPVIARGASRANDGNLDASGLDLVDDGLDHHEANRDGNDTLNNEINTSADEKLPRPIGSREGHRGH